MLQTGRIEFTVLDFLILNLFWPWFVSDFVLRISCFQIWSFEFVSSFVLRSAGPLSCFEFTFALLNDLSRLHQRPLRNRQANLIGGFQIDDELKPHRLLHRQIGRLGSLQDSVHEICDALVALRDVRSVVHEPASLYSFFAWVHRR